MMTNGVLISIVWSLKHIVLFSTVDINSLRQVCVNYDIMMISKCHYETTVAVSPNPDWTRGLCWAGMSPEHH